MIMAGPERSKAGRPRVDDLAKREESLLAVTEAALLELGYERATLNVVARRAGVSKQTIYAKYGGKQGLLRAVLQRIADRSLGDGFAEADELSLRDGLYERARMILRINQSAAAMAITAISMRESQRFPEFREAMLEAKRLRQQEPLRRYLESFRARGLLRDVDCERISEILLWLLAETMVHVVASGEQDGRTQAQIDAQAALIVDMVVNGIAPRS